ncbi:MAG: VCBS repeat-containing protein, partial [Ignavibacteria bacterium]|nr:VCBS repeat-containing protein [Ignavibacteria bacterium]
MRLHYHLILLGTLSVFFATSHISAQVFTDVAGEVGLVLDHLDSGICNVPVASGSAWADFDNDDDVDLYVTNHGGPNYLYRNEGDDDGDGLPSFIEVASASGVDLPDESSHAAVFVDIDNDGDQDLYVTNWGGNILYLNLLIETGVPLFEDVTLTAGVGDAGRAVTATWADYNQDSYLDLYLAKHRNCPGDPQSQDHLYRNNGDGTFADVSGSLCPGGVAPCSQLTGLGFTGGWFDFDNDGDQDLYLVNDYPTGSYVNVLWRNDGPDGLGGWIFTDISVQSGTDIGANGMGLGVADYDN